MNRQINQISNSQIIRISLNRLRIRKLNKLEKINKMNLKINKAPIKKREQTNKRKV
jgi:hypothetical protein